MRDRFDKSGFARSAEHRQGVWLATGGLLLISLDSLGIRLSGAASWEVAFWLGIFMAISMSVWIPLRGGRSIASVVRGQGAPLVASGLLQGASTGLFIVALHHTSVASVMAIFAATPAVAAAIALWAIGEPTRRRTWLGIAGASVGLLVVVSGSLSGGRVLGEALALAAIVAFGANITLWRRHPTIDRQAAVGFGGAALAALAWVPASPGAVDVRALAILAVLGLATGPAGRVFLAMSTRMLPVAQVGLLTPVETIAATAWAWLFLGEVPAASVVAGGVLVLGSVTYGVREA